MVRRYPRTLVHAVGVDCALRCRTITWTAPIDGMGAEITSIRGDDDYSTSSVQTDYYREFTLTYDKVLIILSV